MSLIKSISGIRGTIGGRAGDNLTLDVTSDHRRTGAVNTKVAVGLLRQIGATQTAGADGVSAGRWDVPR